MGGKRGENKGQKKEREKKFSWENSFSTPQKKEGGSSVWFHRPGGRGEQKFLNIKKCFIPRNLRAQKKGEGRVSRGIVFESGQPSLLLSLVFPAFCSLNPFLLFFPEMQKKFENNKAARLHSAEGRVFGIKISEGKMK